MPELDLRVERVVVGGDGLAHDPDGRVVFVAGALPGERVRVALREERRDFAKGEVVEVRPGYGRNYLLPRGLATIPTGHNLRLLERYKIRVKQAREARMADLRNLAGQLQNLSDLVTVEANANEEGQLYGTVTPSMIADALREHKLKVDARCVQIPEPIKKVGTYDLDIALHKDIVHKLKVWVITTKAVKPADAPKK